MLDPVLTLSAVVHLGLLGLIWWFIFKALYVPLRERPIFLFVFLWATLVVAAHFSSIVEGLDALAFYVPASFASLCLLYGTLAYVARRPITPPLVSEPFLKIAHVPHPRLARFSFHFLLATLGIFALISIILGLSVYPDNADSMIYRLPRAVWYVSHGSFLHPFDAFDKRLAFYPLDGVALYVPLVLYGLPGVFHALPSLVAWLFVVYITYRFARSVGAVRLIALLSAWLVGMTPNILAQATSTNDEILAGVALLAGLYMIWRFLITGQKQYVLTFALAVGLSAGTKLHIVFLLPIVGVFLLMAVRAAFNRPVRFTIWRRAMGWRTLIISLLWLAIMFAPFLIYNHISTGRIYFLDDFKGEVFNLAGSLKGGTQNLLIYLSQMIISPIGDLNFWPIANERQIFNNILNEIFYPLINPLLDKDPSLYHMAYRFVGVVLPVSSRFVEFSLWGGFVWLLWFWQIRGARMQKEHPLRGVMILLASVPALWLLIWSFSTLYMEGTATYFTFYLICAAPTMVLTFGRIRRTWLSDLRWVFVIFVVATNLLIAHNLVMYSGFRALPDLYFAKELPFDWMHFDKKVVHELREADRIRIAFTHEKLPFFGFMHWNPRATYYTPYAGEEASSIPERENVLQILPISSLERYGFTPIKIPGKKTIGMTYLGLIRGIGREAVFAKGRGVEERYPQDSNYIVMGASMGPSEEGGYFVMFGRNIAGLSKKDNLSFEYHLFSGDKEIFSRPAEESPYFLVRMEQDPQKSNLLLKILVHDISSGNIVTEATYHLGGMGRWLPLGPDY